MPVYEEKLISPLAVRYTQEHIKTLFRDGHVVEDSAVQIEAHPGSGEYDLVLHAPFPQIEIIRWGLSSCEEGGHWFTLDNRRLYCLQRAALKYWPKRVAAKVEILYADPGVVRRKYDSSTLGASVTVAHSCKDAPLFRWDWRAELPSLGCQALESQAGWDAVAKDDGKEDVDDLSDVAESAGPDSTLLRALEYELAQESAKLDVAPKRIGTVRSPTPSTAAASEDSDSTPRNAQQRDSWSFEKASADWYQQPATTGSKHDGRAMHATQALLEITHQLRAPNSDGRLRIPNWNERYGRRLGSLRRFLEARPDTFVVIPEKEGKFRVQEVPDMDAVAWAGGSSCNDPEWAATAAQAVKEISKQLNSQGGAGNVRIDDWNGRFAYSLGPFKSFIRSRPAEFDIVPSTSRFFKVALVGAS